MTPEFRHETRTRAKIGVLVPFTNTNLEPDMMLMRCPGTTVHFQRMGGYDVDEIPGSDQMAGLGASDISHDLRMISGVRPDVVLYGCTSATLTHGPGFDADLAAQIKEGSGAVSLTAAGSLVTAIQVLGAAKVGFSSPYLGEINQQAMDFLAVNGIETVTCADIGRELGNYGQGELTPDEVFDLACQADHAEAEAIVLSCTDMRSVEAVERIEAHLGKPVVTSNQAMMFCLMKALNLPRHKALPGRLFARL
ncbi:maleate cis-trans isomerase family protein [Leisingera sp. ANG-Vp]|uniref:maleate cis-trans isomerase family protein n=1 Tax=Leisingera sp. ANG-Vp TaxID=1577896 RepID=UPI0005804773|nr:Asp/Glu racemase [Leisingera sp. ANG-Vp]KIC21333.1 Asp/Glu racemase [Leisingera sp. ANG-Vp]